MWCKQDFSGGVVPITVKVEDSALDFDTAALNLTVESAPAPPVMTVQMSGSNLEVLWPSSYTTYNLQEATNLMPPVVWSVVTNSPVIQGGNWMVVIPMDGINQFFRLQTL